MKKLTEQPSSVSGPRLLVASNNGGKIREIRALLDGVDVVSPDDLNLHLEVEETGSTFVANAALKARAFASETGLIALADDSGLQVDALDGAPGVFSARYGGAGLDDVGRYRLLLEHMNAFPDPHQRSARFCCTIFVAAPDGRTCQAEGTCEGRIAHAASGENGFGYDPIFFLPDHDCTMAELAAEQKNALSHRAKALKAVYPALQQTFPELSL